MRQIKLTHVGFRAHVKIASRIVSYKVVSKRAFCGTVAQQLTGLFSTDTARRAVSAVAKLPVKLPQLTVGVQQLLLSRRQLFLPRGRSP